MHSCFMAVTVDFVQVMSHPPLYGAVLTQGP